MKKRQSECFEKRPRNRRKDNVSKQAYSGNAKANNELLSGVSILTGAPSRYEGCLTNWGVDLTVSCAHEFPVLCIGVMTDQPFLATARLSLTPVNPSHANELTGLFRDASVRQFLLDDKLVEEQWVEREIVESRQRFDSGSAGLWVVHEAGNNEMIGFTGFRDFFDPPELQLLYGLLPSSWGKGYATEAAAKVVAHAFEQLGFERVVAATDVPNVASIRVMQRLGMVPVHRDGEAESHTLFYELDRESFTRSNA